MWLELEEAQQRKVSVTGQTTNTNPPITTARGLHIPTTQQTHSQLEVVGDLDTKGSFETEGEDEGPVEMEGTA